MCIRDRTSNEIDQYKGANSSFPRFVCVFVNKERLNHEIDRSQFRVALLQYGNESKTLYSIVPLNADVDAYVCLFVSCLNDWDCCITNRNDLNEVF